MNRDNSGNPFGVSSPVRATIGEVKAPTDFQGHSHSGRGWDDNAKSGRGLHDVQQRRAGQRVADAAAGGDARLDGRCDWRLGWDEKLWD